MRIEDASGAVPRDISRVEGANADKVSLEKSAISAEGPGQSPPVDPVHLSEASRLFRIHCQARATRVHQISSLASNTYRVDSHQLAGSILAETRSRSDQ